MIQGQEKWKKGVLQIGESHVLYKRGMLENESPPFFLVNFAIPINISFNKCLSKEVSQEEFI